ncbi:hypothetical protein CPB85DRAFT_1260068 [Mucidula mucida]|nr:hypothetical protein CPB85DRAFT_1260068 [Mucidula mucida]
MPQDLFYKGGRRGSALKGVEETGQHTYFFIGYRRTTRPGGRGPTYMGHSSLSPALWNVHDYGRIGDVKIMTPNPSCSMSDLDRALGTRAGVVGFGSPPSPKCGFSGDGTAVPSPARHRQCSSKSWWLVYQEQEPLGASRSRSKRRNGPENSW